MSRKTCVRCGKPLHTGKMYCNRKCAGAARTEKIKSVAVVPTRDVVPLGLSNYIVSRFGNDAVEILGDVADVLTLSDAPPAPPLYGRTEGAYPPSSSYTLGKINLGDYRPEDALSYTTIELMLQNAQVGFVTTLKKAPIRTVFRNANSWRLEGGDEDLARNSAASLERIFPVHIDEMLTGMDYGATFAEMRWWNVSLKELGIGGDGMFTALKSLDFCYPGSIVKINRSSDNKFDGFQQQLTIGGYYDVPRDQALVITYDGKFRNLWGRSYFRPMYAAWYWYEIVWRCFLRYLERQATPVVVVKAPQRGTVKLKSGQIVEAMDHAVVVGGDISKSNVAAIPSDVDDQSGKPLWELDYLAAEQRTDIFVRALQELGTQILRAGLLADRVATQEASVGSYNIANVHYIMTRLDDERILDGLVSHINQFILPKFTLYNVGAGGPSMMMKTEGLDIEEKSRLFQLLMKLADAKHPQLERIDVLRTLEIENVPMMDDDAWEEFKKEQEEDAKKNLKMQQELMASKQPGTPFPQKGGGGPSVKDQPTDQNQKSKQQALAEIDAVNEALAMGQVFPVYVTEEELQQIKDHVGLEFIDVG